MVSLIADQKGQVSGMQDPHHNPLPTDRLGFYVASGDQEILAQVNRLMQRSGYVGVMDTAGRFQYIVDGRNGTPLAARRILETAGRILRDQQDADGSVRPYLNEAADWALAAHAMRRELKGTRFLRYMLLYAGTDETRLRPVSKTLYPAVASHFRVSTAQVERDVRYALQRTDLRTQGLASAAAICRLHDEMVRRAGEIRNREKPSAVLSDGEGPAHE
jgi:hypothetical protein